MNKLQKSVPFRVRATKRSRQTFREDRPNVSIKDWFNVTRALYMGDEGGIILGLDPSENGKKAVLMSINHLVIDPQHKLAEEVERY